MRTDGIILRVLGTLGLVRSTYVVWLEFIHRDLTVAIATTGATFAALTVLWLQDAKFR